MRERHRWVFSSVYSANRDRVSTYSSTSQETHIKINILLDNKHKYLEIQINMIQVTEGTPVGKCKGSEKLKFSSFGLPRSGFCSPDELIFRDILAVTETNNSYFMMKE